MKFLHIIYSFTTYYILQIFKSSSFSSQFFNNQLFLHHDGIFLLLERSWKKRKRIICHVQPTIFRCWKISITCDYVIFLTAFNEFSIYPDRSQKSKVFPKNIRLLYTFELYIVNFHSPSLFNFFLDPLFIFSLKINHFHAENRSHINT